MNRKGLYVLIALALGGVGAAHAQDNTAAAASSTAASGAPAWPNGFDDRWYVAPTVGGYFNDTDRNTHSRQIFYGLSVGKFISPNVSVELFADRTQRDADTDVFGQGNKWSNNNAGISVRYFFGDWNSWRPYLMGGVMGSYHNNPLNDGWAPAAQAGVGLSKTITDSVDFRVEGAYRYDWDDKTQPVHNGYGDWYLGFSLVARIGPVPAAAAPAPPPQPAAPDCSKQFRNGVNLCDNKCPDLPEGTIVGPDGCPQKVVIDLKGVNFKFDRPKKGETNIEPTLAVPASDSMAILDQAVDTLKRYPQVHVTVAGYTDSVGTAEYNQGLSERRAKIVYDYLTAHGIDASRLEGPIGHGENDPIDTNKTAAGRARNRRTELQVQQ
ncbi:OmpA family protein [Dyella flava]|uniref:OmpA family protein n=1 Tax=Dyella flava TaxID=1920170 RepID=A0ABS2K982_9GAMM|nr:OmpA family protein [Dyella flava]MBM7127504.1 OmpA family protein [Dyella flava]GLQ51103.1 membrane protein [Dyella flava]